MLDVRWCAAEEEEKAGEVLRAFEELGLDEEEDGDDEGADAAPSRCVAMMTA